MAGKFDLYETVTDTIVAALEKGVVPWVKPWTSAGVHRNGESQRAYNGINPLLLEIASIGRGWSSREWYTFSAVKRKDAMVRKGESGTLVTFWKFIKKEDETTFPLLRFYKVFNREQIDGLPEEKAAAPTDFVPMENADVFVNGLGADIRHGGDRAFYIPREDYIGMPKPETFVDRGAYYATLFHELTHWTGHQSRKDRDLRGRFGTETYAMEELVAELGAAFLCDIHGVDGKLQHPEYIGNWLKKLREDKRAIFTASKAAREAVEWMTGTSSVDEQEEAA